MTTTPKPPDVVKTVGMIWAILGGMMIISGAMAFGMAALMNSMTPGGFPPHSDKLPPAFVPIMGVFQYFRELAIAQIFLAAFIVLAALSFMKLHEWARKALLLVSVLAATYVIGFSIFWIYMWVGITQSVQTTAQGSAPSNIPAGFSTFGVVGGVINMVLFSIPPILSVIVLCRKDVRAAML